MGVEDLLRFPYVTRPPLLALRQALRHLCIVGALDIRQGETGMIQRDAVEDYLGSSGIGGHQFEKWSRDPTSINDLGVVLSKIPVSPKYAKMILASHKYEGLFIYAVMIVACMSVPEIYTSTSTSPQAEA